MFLVKIKTEEKPNELNWEILLADYLMFLIFIIVLALCIVVFVKSITTLLVRLEVIKWPIVKPAG